MTPNARDLVRKALAPDCPTWETLTALFDGTLPHDAAAPARNHLNGCASCHARWRLIEEFHAGQPSAAERADVAFINARLARPALPQTEPSWWRRLIDAPALPRFAFAAAALVVAVAIGVEWRTSRLSSLNSVRLTEEMRSTATIRVSPSGDLAAPPAEITWTSAPDAVSFEITLQEVDGASLWQTTTTGLSVAIPANVRARILPGKTLIIRVTARDSAGQPNAASEPNQFRIAPKTN